MKIESLCRVRAADRFRSQLATAIEILRIHRDHEVTEDLLGAVTDLAGDLVKAVEGYRQEGEFCRD